VLETGKEAEVMLDQAGITVNKNTIPFETRPPMIASGVRIGTPACTTRNMKEPQMKQIADLIDHALKSNHDEKILSAIQGDVKQLCAQFPFYKSHLKG